MIIQDYQTMGNIVSEAFSEPEPPPIQSMGQLSQIFGNRAQLAPEHLEQLQSADV